MSQYLIRGQATQPDILPSPQFPQSYMQMQQMRLSSIFQTPLVKMSYNDYLIKQNQNVISISLPDNSKNQQYTQMFKKRQIYQKQVVMFREQKQTHGGSYYFYNWVSEDQMICQIARNGAPLLATLIFSFQYQKALMLIQKWEKSIITETLSIVFKGFVNVIKIVQNDPELRKIFFQRKMCVKNVFVEGKYNYNHNKLLLMDNSQQLETSLQSLATLDQKVECVLANIGYLKKFLVYFPSKQINDYYKLIFAFLSNTEDQLQSKNMYNMLLNCRDLNLLDRLNFAQKLMPLQSRKQFIKQFEKTKIMSLTNLSNLLFFQSTNDEAIETIIINYLDEYGDLESVATVCLEYGNLNLMRFIDMYQQILVISCEQKKAQDLQNQQYKKRGPFCFTRPPTPQPLHNLFLSHINFQQQKIQPVIYKSQQSTQFCYVCFRQKQLMQDLFVQCGRCKHGGHLSHLLKWYQQSNNVCPKTDCSCYCV